MTNATTQHQNNQIDNTQYQQWLESCLLKQQNNIQRHILPNQQVVWVRRSDSHNSIWLYRLLGIFTLLLKADALNPVPSLGGKIAIVNEAEALKRLSKAGVRVPQLLAKNDNALMISDFTNSQTLVSVLSQSQQQQDLLANWQLGVQAITDIHAKEQHVSQCFARNMLVCADGQIAFIDFEDAPEKVLSLSNCQIRDWLCYLFSTASLLDNEDTRQKAIMIWKNVLAENADTVSAEIYRNVRFLLWARHLHDKRWRSDTLRFAGVMRFVWGISQNTTANEKQNL